MSLTKELKLPAALNQLVTHPRNFRRQNRLEHGGGTRVPGNPVMDAESSTITFILYINKYLVFMCKKKIA